MTILFHVRTELILGQDVEDCTIKASIMLEPPSPPAPNSNQLSNLTSSLKDGSFFPFSLPPVQASIVPLLAH